ncbi:hypothetical protein DFH07DRAFT_744420 [Mycena maculata]|uniref:Uncharacterized protein n=1 Tax=Mycena maculata TaxID=230809 RepID=A0AAD7J1Q1_9AGAR|nr:hypothetical protein DFH07DRAFT_744420 [Mycena maculata]
MCRCPPTPRLRGTLASPRATQEHSESISTILLYFPRFSPFQVGQTRIFLSSATITKHNDRLKSYRYRFGRHLLVCILQSHTLSCSKYLFNSCAGVWQNDRVEIIVNDPGNRTTQTYVSTSNVAQRLTFSIFDAKRLIGRKFDGSKVQADMRRSPSPGSKPYIRGSGTRLGGEDFDNWLVNHFAQECFLFRLVLQRARPPSRAYCLRAG